MSVTRRGMLNMLQGLAVLGAASKTGLLEASAQTIELLGKSEAFTDDYVLELARARAKKPFVEEKIQLPPGLDNLTYDQYRDIRFNPEKSIWRGQPHGFSVDLFHSGFYYTSPVDIFIVDNGEQAKLNYVPDLFTFGPLVQQPKGDMDLHYAGFRLRYPINSKDYNDEFCVFQGASYFRAIGKGHLYGLSARGLAIDTGQPNGEEFPFFLLLDSHADTRCGVGGGVGAARQPVLHRRLSLYHQAGCGDADGCRDDHLPAPRP
jgi:glucans biosynthesis protein